MKITLLASFCALVHWLHCQDADYHHLRITYKPFGLGSDAGDSNVVFTLHGNRLESHVRQAIPLSDIRSENDTLGLQPFVFGDSIFYIQPSVAYLHDSSVAAIYSVLRSMTSNIITDGNFCIRSGSLYEIRIAADSIAAKRFSMFNTFDSVALEITNILFPYFPKNTIEFRPLHKWKLAIRCNQQMKNRTRTKELPRKEPEVTNDRKRAEDAIQTESKIK